MCVCVCVCVCERVYVCVHIKKQCILNIILSIMELRGAFNKFPDFF